MEGEFSKLRNEESAIKISEECMSDSQSNYSAPQVNQIDDVMAREIQAFMPSSTSAGLISSTAEAGLPPEI